jgi:hypothetical protein
VSQRAIRKPQVEPADYKPTFEQQVHDRLKWDGEVWINDFGARYAVSAVFDASADVQQGKPVLRPKGVKILALAVTDPGMALGARSVDEVAEVLMAVVKTL